MNAELRMVELRIIGGINVVGATGLKPFWIFGSLRIAGFESLSPQRT